MNRKANFFLLVIAPIFAIILVILGMETVHTNLLGWFLILLGVGYPIGVVIVYWIRKRSIWLPIAGGAVVQEERNDFSYWLVTIGMLVAFYLPPVEFLLIDPVLPRNGWFQLIGGLLLLLGGGLFIWARRVLRNSYSGHLAVTEKQELVQSGPYNMIRHPAYAGYLIMASGLCIGYSSLGGLAATFLFMLPGIIYRIKIEDSLLEAHFGEQFKLYASRVARLVPGIW